MSEIHSSTTTLVIADVEILQDIHGRYSLNTLHKASGGKHGKEPSRWLENTNTQELIGELASQNTLGCIDVVKGGNAPGTYAHELLAVSYAGWISPAFQLKVNQAFLNSKSTLAPSLPTLHDPAYQMLMQAVIDLDATRHHVAQIEVRQRAQDLEMLANQQKTIEALQLSHTAQIQAARAEGRAEHAEEVAQEAVAATGRQTIEAFILGNHLLPQFPGRLDALGRRTWPGETRRLKDYCERYGWSIIPVPVVGKTWPTENGYPYQALCWLCQHPTIRTQLALVPGAQGDTGGHQE